MNLIVNLFLPTIVLGVLNCLVYQALKKSTSLSTQLRRSGRGEEAMRKRDIRLTRIAIVIVGVFLACHLPRFIPNIVEMLFGLPPAGNPFTPSSGSLHHLQPLLKQIFSESSDSLMDGVFH